jgi:hypothetical protein
VRNSSAAPKIPPDPSSVPEYKRSGPILVSDRGAPSDLNRLVEEILATTQASGVAVAVRGARGLYCSAASGSTAPQVGTELGSGTGLTNLSLTTGRMQLCNDTEQDTRADSKACRDLGIRSMLVLPLNRDGRTLGVLDIFSSRVNAFDEECIAAALGFAAQACSLAIGPLQMSTSTDPQVEELAADDEPTVGSEDIDHTGIRGWNRALLAIVAVAAIVGAGGLFLKHRAHVFVMDSTPVRRAQPADAVPSTARLGPQTAVDDGRQQAIAMIRGRASDEKMEDVLQKARAGNATAEYQLAIRYANGAEVPQDLNEAMVWFEKAAVKGIASAQWKLGIGYLSGVGIASDDTKAVNWLARAANQGHIGAQRLLSQLYLQGRGVRRDGVRAYTWAAIAAGARDASSTDNEQLNSIRSGLTSSQLEEAGRRIRNWWALHRAPVNGNGGQQEAVKGP